MIVESILDLCGSTPLVPLRHVIPGQGTEILLKLEGFNPGHSIKDRPILRMTDVAEESGRIGPGSVLIESTSGNTGIALAMIGAVRGYSIICVVDENMLTLKRQIMEALGAQLLAVRSEHPEQNVDLTEQRIEVVSKLVSLLGDSTNLNQYSNPANPESHYLTTANEIWKATDGEVDCVVVSVGTGGTVSGVGRRIKELSTKVVICAVEPTGSIMFGGTKGTYLQQGPGNYFIPLNLDHRYVDVAMKVTDKDAFHMTRRLAREEGILVGGDSGGLVHIAIQLASEHPQWKRVVVICPDSIEKYLDTVFSDTWMEQHKLLYYY